MVPLNVSVKLPLLIKGQASYKSPNLGFNLLIARVQKKYAADGSDAALKACVAEMTDFMDKYKLVMEAEYPSLAKL